MPATVRPKRVLISQHATITHYRVRFYELLELRRPPAWDFDVVFDSGEAQKPRVYLEKVDPCGFGFHVLNVRTHIVCFLGHRLMWQTFFWKARKYDAIITDNFMSHLTYVLSYLYRFTGVKRALWGHVRDRNVRSAGIAKGLSERIKRQFLRWTDFFFAYTPGEREAATLAGIPSDRIVVLNNTIDVRTERDACLSRRAQRDAIRERYGVSGKCVILYVGRLLPAKRIGYLLDTFRHLRRTGGQYHLFVVGAGEDEPLVRTAVREMGSEAVTYFGPLVGVEAIAPVYLASDLYILPGFVGLAPLQAFCYDLPAVVFDLPTHSPEIEYLTPENSVTLPEGTSSQALADQIPRIVAAFSEPAARERIYASVAHLTIENMVDQFVEGVNRMLEVGAGLQPAVTGHSDLDPTHKSRDCR